MLPKADGDNLTTKKHHSILTIFLIIVVCANLLNVRPVLADGETPTEPPAPTQVETEPPVESTPTPVESTPAPIEATPTPEADIPPTATTEVPPPPETTVDENTPVEVILSAVPEDTNVVVLDEQGQPLVLGSQETVDALVTSDPVWCPASVAAPTPGLNNCSVSYAGITELLDAMRINPTAFDEDGTIFLEKPPGQGFTTPLILDDSATSLAGAFATLSGFNLTIRGGWNGNSPGTFSGNTNFGAAGGNQGYILIGSATNPWAGNITLRDLTLSGISVANSVTVYTSSGNIVLSDVEVGQQAGTNYTGYLVSDSGNITVGNTSLFDGDNTGGDRNKGFYAKTTTGSISITGTGTSPTFQDARGTDPDNYNGATLSAPTVTLTNVISQDHDGNGIAIYDANVVTLNNVVSGLLPTVGNPPFSEGNGLSGVLVNGTGSTTVIINGGSFNRNGRYGIEILSSGAISIVSNPSYDGNVLGNFFENTAPDTSITSTPPSITGNTAASFSFTGADNFTPPGNLTFQCSRDGAAFAACTSPITYTGLSEGNHNFLVRALDQSGNTDPSPASFSWIIDFTPPTISPHGDETAEAASPAGAVVNYTSPATFDAVDGPGVAACSPASGSLFALGNTTVTCTASDTAGNAATPTFFVVHVLDTTAPILNLPANITANSTGPAGAVVSYSASAIDIVDGPVSTNCAPASGSTFPLGSTTVNCSAVDSHGNSANGSFMINVQDPGGPTLNLPANIVTEATSPAGAVVNYSASATDIVDGNVPVTCLPASGSLFALGATTVNCTASDLSGNTNNAAFLITVVDTTTAATPSSPQAASGFTIPITGGGVIDLDCNSIFWMTGIKVSFLNLCDYQSEIKGVDANGLPDILPEGYSFVLGLDVDVFYNGPAIKNLPDGSGVQIDFPVYDAPKEQFAVLYWSDEDGNGTGEWLEISQAINSDKISQVLSANPENELYYVNLDATEESVYKILTTEKPGIFVLVKK